MTDYRFMTFYLESSADNMRIFFNQVVDATWLASDDPDAIALRSCSNRDTGLSWRILHRVTYVSRVMERITSVQDQLARGTAVVAKKVDVASNYQLIRTLGPYISAVKEKAELIQPLRRAFDVEYPMLLVNDDHLADVLDLLVEFYELVE